MYRLSALALSLLLLCACAPQPRIVQVGELPASLGREVITVLPFLEIMTPEAVGERVLNRFVDTLNELGPAKGYFFVILKESDDRIDRDWLRGRPRIRGELFGYQEESGCCATFITLNGKASFLLDGNDRATLSISYPGELALNHSVEHPEELREEFIASFATTLATTLFERLPPHAP